MGILDMIAGAGGLDLDGIKGQVDGLVATLQQTERNIATVALRLEAIDASNQRTAQLLAQVVEALKFVGAKQAALEAALSRPQIAVEDSTDGS